MREPRAPRLSDAIRFLTGIAVGAYGIYWGNKTPGAGTLEVLGVVCIVAAPITLVLRLRGWPGLLAMLHQQASETTDDSEG